MRVFVDECVNRRLLRYLIGYNAIHATDTHLRSMKNGDLLRAVALDYDVFLTLDRNIPFQQNLKKLPLTFVIMRSPSNALRDLLPLIPDVLITLAQIEQSAPTPGDLYEVVPR